MSFPRYPAYKDTGIRWLGQVPTHWHLMPLWSCFSRTKRTGFEDEVLLSVYRDYGVIPKASRDDNFNKPSDDLSVYQLVNVGDLVVNKMKAWQGSVAISDHRGIVSPAYFVYESLHGEVPRFFHYLMRCDRYITGYLSISEGVRVNQWDMDPALHSRMPLLIPGKKEQEEIADFLDHETAKIDALVAEQEQLITLLKEKRQAVISHAVTKGLDPSVPMKDSGVEWLGEVPAHWEVKQIRQITQILRGKFTHRPRNDPAFYDGDYPFIQTGDVTGAKRYITEFKQTLNDKGAAVSKEFPRGTLVMTIAANIGDVAVLDFPAYFPDSMVGLVPGSNFDLMFLFYLAKSMKQPLEMNATISTQMNLNAEQIGSLSACCPPIDQQRQIVLHLDAETQQLDELIDEAQVTTALLKERRSALISAAVTGQIDVRGLAPAQEQAA